MRSVVSISRIEKFAKYQNVTISLLPLHAEHRSRKVLEEAGWRCVGRLGRISQARGNLKMFEVPVLEC